jgi:hypothetical protein
MSFTIILMPLYLNVTWCLTLADFNVLFYSRIFCALNTICCGDVLFWSCLFRILKVSRMPFFFLSFGKFSISVLKMFLCLFLSNLLLCPWLLILVMLSQRLYDMHELPYLFLCECANVSTLPSIWSILWRLYIEILFYLLRFLFPRFQFDIFSGCLVLYQNHL